MRSDYLPFGKPSFSDQEIDAVAETLRSGWIGMGNQTKAFESELAQHLGAGCVVTTNSCTSALYLSLLVNDIGQGDEVICPSLTWLSTANAALMLGATPVFCDIDPDSLCVTPESVQQKLTDKTRAVLVVHFGGRAADVAAIRAVLPPNIVIIEDAAHALGSRFENGTAVGSSGNLTCFSFYANKNLSTAEGGAIALADGALGDRLRSLIMHGMPSNAWSRFVHPLSQVGCEPTELGFKMNFTDLQASIGRVQLRRQGGFARIRRSVALAYHDALSDLGVTFQAGCLDPGHARHLVTVLLPLEDLDRSRNEILLALRKQNIGASIHYAPLHRMPFYATSPPADLPKTEYVCSRILTLPISASMKPQDTQDVIDAVKSILSRVTVTATHSADSPSNV